ncbi:LLM class flavin-dependent oxidoreductase [Actinophytocola oryzae]|uniref:Alkanesulfonate monooxygenase SsuD/methylene tetrahydromethanopterin reductase-like flavin-dependent oxidoreductase (Luciferase family) n=1 Tax=Actinophytocola oryzae TaxID=502181 RepID=A0A4R7VYP2_9PSEU|nr:LLM class flavin-dependent oxidoreductase [Actinophytocola oryzae]TDV55310.1 alkanesulfonate monooxygenase SsuD/methylene tetrahydromethanopterin reductase-like flavin-dependent oxidoreductase (luciferase family) [Actinophytocola oryzae]
MTKLGVVFRPQFAPERMREIASALDESGLDEVWLWEDCFLASGIASAVALLGFTERVRVGVGLLPVPLRNVALSAMEVATVERLFPGRATFAFGHGLQKWMGQAGVRAESPVTLLREYLVALKGLLAGETVTVSGRYVNLDAVRLERLPETPPPVISGAFGPKSLAMCAEVADGLILAASAGPDGVREMRATTDKPIIAYARAAFGAGAQERLDAEESPEYGRANDDVPGMIQEYVEAGVTTLVLQPTPDEPDLEGFVHIVAGLKQA